MHMCLGICEGRGEPSLRVLLMAFQNHHWSSICSARAQLLSPTLCPPAAPPCAPRQVCSKLPESGVCDPATWRALLGAGAVPADIAKLRSEDSADEDLASSDRVWLMGEQRWEDKKRLRKP